MNNSVTNQTSIKSCYFRPNLTIFFFSWKLKNMWHFSKVFKTYHYFWKKLNAIADIMHKGQLISKCLFGIFNSPKKRTNKFDFTTMKPQVDLSSFVFWRKLKTPKRHFEIHWPLYVNRLTVFIDNFQSTWKIKSKYSLL